MIRLNAILFLFLFGFSTLLSAQEEVRGKLHVPAGPFYPGDIIPVELELILPEESEPKFPKQHPDFPPLKPIGSPGPVQTYSSGLMRIHKQAFSYIALDSITTLIGVETDSGAGKLSVLYNTASGTQAFSFEPAAVKVVRIPVDTTQPLRAAYGIEEPIMEPLFPWWWIAIAVALVLLLALLIFFLTRRRKQQAWSIPANKDPRQWALQQIALVEKKRPFGIEEQKQQIALLTDIVRLYIERRSGFPAPYHLNAELMEYLSTSETLSALNPSLGALIDIANPIKFGGYVAEDAEEEQVLNLCKELVESAAWLNFEAEKKGVAHV
jgi:hypothetical protein